MRGYLAVASIVLLVAGVACRGQKAAQTSVRTGGSAGAGNAAGNGENGGEGRDWDPEAEGMDSCRLAEGLRSIDEMDLNISSMMVLRHGHVVVDVRPTGDPPDIAYDVQSVTKSVLSALTGVALEEGYIPSLDTPILELLPELELSDPVADKSEITVEHLLTMTSGIEYDHGDQSEPFLTEANSAQFILGHPMAATPGTLWAYSSADTQLLSAIISHQTGMSAEAYAETRLFGPLGITPGTWRADAGGVTVGGFGLTLTARDMARFGQLYLNQGEWTTASGFTEQVVPKDYVAASVLAREQTSWSRGSFGYLWWIKSIGGYCAGGRYGQQINVFPDEELVVVYTADLPLESADATLDELTERYVLEAIESYAPGSPQCPLPSFAGAGGQGPTASCTNQAFELLPNADVDEVTQIYSYGDGTTTHCLTETEPGTFCLEGTAADAGADYERWGAGIGLRLAEVDDAGVVIAPFDAAAHGIAGVRFTVEGAKLARYGLRVGVAQVDTDDLDYLANPFLENGGVPALREDGSHDVMFSTMTQPSWSDLPPGTSLVSSQLDSISVQIVTQPGSSFDFAFCISDVTWLDSDANPYQP